MQTLVFALESRIAERRKPAMKTATLFRAGSVSPRTEMSGRSPSMIHNNGASLICRCRSMRMFLNLKEKTDPPLPAGLPNSLRRVRSDTDISLLKPFRLNRSSSAWFEEEEDNKLVMRMSPAVAEEAKELSNSGGGIGNGRKIGGGRGGQGNGETNHEDDPGIGGYYEQMLRADPENPLLLRNYGRFLHEVEGDLKKAEECYGRAILASPNDGELLSLYGRLVWESQRDIERAESYYELAVEASPEDCYVMGSYAHFLWDAEEKGHEEKGGGVASSSSFVEAF